jgi:SAM-dependent methyltransferase
VTESVAADERYRRERDFHDVAFATGARAKVSKWYPQDSPSKRAYATALGRFAPGQRVVEYGCGPGSAAFGLAAAGVEVTGIDISPVAVEQARARADELGLDVTFAVMNAEALELDDGTFDGVCGSGILHHLDLRRSFDEVARVLRPTGSAVFLEPLGHNPAIRAYRALTPKLRTDDEHPLVLADLELAGERFSTVDPTFHQLLWLLSVPLRGLPGGSRLAGILERCDDRLFAAVPRVRRHAWTTVIRLRGPRPR